MGFSVQFTEGSEQIAGWDLGGEWNRTCEDWSEYQAAAVFPQDDSGVADVEHGTNDGIDV